jgi:hypothetical protein
VVRVLINETDIDALIRRGYLDQSSRDDLDALKFGIGSFIDDALNAAV